MNAPEVEVIGHLEELLRAELDTKSAGLAAIFVDDNCGHDYLSVFRKKPRMNADKRRWINSR
jgi:hypothetical protein